MPPIPVHLDDPINTNTATKPDGTTPQTSSDPAPTRTSAIPTHTSSASDPPPPQPGAVPSIPAPTAALSSITSSASNNPSQPQPGATPSAYSTTTAAILGYPTSTQPPPQASIPPPQSSSQYTKSTIADSAAGAGGRTYPTPTTLNMGPAAAAASPVETGAGVASIAHPPGYTQNEAAFRHVPSAQETGSGPLLGGLGGGNFGGGGGGLGGAGAGTGEGEGTVVGNVMKGLESAGEQLRKGEEAVWKWVGGKSR